jgi:hypothetical protein
LLLLKLLLAMLLLPLQPSILPPPLRDTILADAVGNYRLLPQLVLVLLAGLLLALSVRL